MLRSLDADWVYDRTPKYLETTGLHGRQWNDAKDLGGKSHLDHDYDQDNTC
jgi:hypothetical protein